VITPPLGLRLGGEARNALDVLDSLVDDAAAPRGRALATGFPLLDDVLNGGLRAADLVLVGGKPGQGKTTVALQWARHLAANGTQVLYACYEHDALSLLMKLLRCELGDLVARGACDDQLRLETLRDRLRDVAVGDARPVELLGSDPLLVEAVERVRAYGADLVLVPATGSTDLPAIEDLVDRHPSAGALFIDYLQKVPVPASTESERVTRLADHLKDLALRRSLAVVAIAAADGEGLASRRLRIQHFRGSTALAYESDVVIVLNEKMSIVSRLHLAYDSIRAPEFRDRVVFSIEKNRNGLADVHLEFRKDFANHRFDPRGHWVSERLWDEGSPEE
jgi:replicative DNA helicase